MSIKDSYIHRSCLSDSEERRFEWAERITKKCFLTKDVKVFYTEASNKFKLRLDDARWDKKFSCNCNNFKKWAICMHVVAYLND